MQAVITPLTTSIGFNVLDGDFINRVGKSEGCLSDPAAPPYPSVSRLPPTHRRIYICYFQPFTRVFSEMLLLSEVIYYNQLYSFFVSCNELIY